MSDITGVQSLSCTAVVKQNGVTCRAFAWVVEKWCKTEVLCTVGFRMCCGAWGLFCMTSVSMALFTSSFICILKTAPFSSCSWSECLSYSWSWPFQVLLLYLTQSCLLAFFLSAFLQFTFLYSLEPPHPDLLCQPSLVSFLQSPVTFSVLLADIGLNFDSSSKTVRWLLFFSTETTRYFILRSWLVFVTFSEKNETA